MVRPATILIAVVLVSIALVAMIVIRPEITGTRGGKILAFVALFIFPVLSGWMGYSDHVERSKTTAFCLSCHVMEDYGKSLWIDESGYLAAAHFQNNRVPRDYACYTCHTNYTLYGDFSSKLRGLKHVWVNYFGKIPKPAEIKLYTPYNNRECLHCHLGARSFAEGAIHNLEEGRMAQIKSNQLSCLSSDCHSTVHNVKDLNEKTFWDPNKEPQKAAEETEVSGEESQTTPEASVNKPTKKRERK